MVISLPSLGFAVLAGLVTVLSPCILPILPLLVGRSLQSHRYGPMALVAGLIAGFATIGSLLGVTASWFSSFTTVLRNGAIGLLFGVGVLSIFPKLSSRLFSRLQFSRFFQEPTQVGLIGEFWLGTQLGLLWSPCAGPVLGSILIVAAVKHDIVTAFVLLAFYGFGAGIPLLVIAYGGRYLSQRLLGLRFHGPLLQRVAGVIVAVTAIAILLGWDVQIQQMVASMFPTLPL